MAVRRLAAEQPDSFAFTEKNLAWAKKLIDRYPAGRQASAVIPLLWRAQEQHDGWVCEPAIRYIADLLDMPHIRVLEVATFYTMFQLQPVGKKAHIQVCGTTPCQLRGSEELINICKSRIAKHMHEISEDGMFSWEEVECLGACVNAPMVQIFKDTYEDLTPDSFNALLDDISAGKEVTPGPQNGRRFAMAEGGQTSLTEIDDDTKGVLPVPHLVDGNEKASHAFAGGPINADGNDYDGVPTPAEDAVAKVKAAFAAKQAGESVAETEKKVEKAAEKPSEPKPVSKAKPKSAEAPAEPAAAKKAPAAAAAVTDVAEKEPEILKEARGGKPDDLKQLKGVGPKLETTLHELGFFHFDQVANWGPAEIAWVDSRLKFKGRIERDGWVAQAKILAEGGETEFSKRVAKGTVPSSKNEG
ncbi:NADH-quinone oxidoreductase subunit E [Roseibium polysiphoniae]|uniref:NADH-quinone oxidoreductase subunit E n=1 Tax=Roseibium polysiphoniae TaxID=2571221 RepID=A0ABR9C785_9HYPH|nr:NADH-quinone oxidoreductase subunit E [Roseibium polysiphoniae]MBD8875754.1 NADH-quinone oxidoreductase subunit E [Roseibium polysiphoniae]